MTAFALANLQVGTIVCFRSQGTSLRVALSTPPAVLPLTAYEIAVAICCVSATVDPLSEVRIAHHRYAALRFIAVFRN